MTRATATTTPLLDVEQAGARLEKARIAFHLAIYEAHQSGASLRAIAEAANMSHEKIRSLVRADS